MAVVHYLPHRHLHSAAHSHRSITIDTDDYFSLISLPKHCPVIVSFFFVYRTPFGTGNMGHDVLVAVGVVVQLKEADPDAHFEELLAIVKHRCPTVKSFFYAYSVTPEAMYFLRGREGYDSTDKAYLFTGSTLIWTERCDGSSVKYFHDRDGLQDPEQFINKILEAKERVADAMGSVLNAFGEDVTVSSPQIIRSTSSYE